VGVPPGDLPDRVDGLLDPVEGVRSEVERQHELRGVPSVAIVGPLTASPRSVRWAKARASASSLARSAMVDGIRMLRH
jgi:hypothetical protein